MCGQQVVRTNTVDIELNLGTKDLVPLENCVNQVTTTLERPSAAERVCKRGIGRKISVDGLGLLIGRSLGKLFHYSGDFFNRIVHGCLKFELIRRLQR